jgi:SAM-dependent methyltransferase
MTRSLRGGRAVRGSSSLYDAGMDAPAASAVPRTPAPGSLDRVLANLPAAWRVRLSRRPAERRIRDLSLRLTDRGDQETFREDLARRYIRGEGIEIGALHRPLRVPPHVRVRYVDLMSREELVATYSSAVYGNPGWVVETDVIDDCERLASFAEQSVDFVIANHILEHTEDPIGALQHLTRVVRSGGTVFITLPDASRTFDQLRARTTVEHVLRDHRDGPEISREEHYREWAMVECLPPERVPERIAQFARERTRHHFHVWEVDGFLELLRALDLPATLELAQRNLDEFAVVLRRQ